ncbi:MAG: glycosyltransferase family 39 protein [bacterium]
MAQAEIRSESNWWLTYRWPILVAVIAVLVRLIYLLELSSQPGFDYPMVDEKWHWEWAHEIISGPFWGEGAWFRAPLYPYMLAFLAWITNGSVFWSKFLQVLLCGGTAVFIYRLAHRLFGTAEAIVSGLAYAVYGTLLFYEQAFLIPVLFLLLLTWGMDRLVAHWEVEDLQPWLCTGLVFGLAAITRPNILLVLPFLAALRFLAQPSVGKIAVRLRRPLVLAAGVVLIIIPVTVRNLIVTGDFILISSQGGINLYLGNNEKADGLTMLMPEVDLDESVSWRQFGVETTAAAKREAGRELSEAEQSSFWTSKAIDFVLEHPGHFASLVWRKCVYLVSGFENSDNSDIYWQRDRSVLYSALVWHKWIYFPFGVLLPLAVGGIILHRRRWRDLMPVYVFGLAYIPSIVLFLVTARHRLPLVPFLIILASAGAVYLVRRWRVSGASGLIAPLVVILVTGWIFNQTWFGQEKVRGVFQTCLNNGIQFEKEDKFSEAEVEYLAADAAFPYSATLVNNLGWCQYRLGKLELAQRNLERAIKLDPEYAWAYNNLSLVMRDQGQMDSSLALLRHSLRLAESQLVEPEKLGQLRLNLAQWWDMSRNLDSAAAAHEMAMQVAPEWTKAYTSAAAFYARHQGYRHADSLYMVAMDLGDMTGVDLFNWGLALISGGRPHHGRGLMLRAIELEPSLYEAWYCIAAAHLQEGAPRDSVQLYLEKCLDADSAYPPALELLKVLDTLRR